MHSDAKAVRLYPAVANPEFTVEIDTAAGRACAHLLELDHAGLHDDGAGGHSDRTRRASKPDRHTVRLDLDQILFGARRKIFTQFPRRLELGMRSSRDRLQPVTFVD